MHFFRHDELLALPHKTLQRILLSNPDTVEHLSACSDRNAVIAGLLKAWPKGVPEASVVDASVSRADERSAGVQTSFRSSTLEDPRVESASARPTSSSLEIPLARLFRTPSTSSSPKIPLAEPKRNNASRVSPLARLVPSHTKLNTTNTAATEGAPRTKESSDRQLSNIGKRPREDSSGRTHRASDAMDIDNPEDAAAFIPHAHPGRTPEEPRRDLKQTRQSVRRPKKRPRRDLREGSSRTVEPADPGWLTGERGVTGLPLATPEWLTEDRRIFLDAAYDSTIAMMQDRRRAWPP